MYDVHWQIFRRVHVNLTWNKHTRTARHPKQLYCELKNVYLHYVCCIACTKMSRSMPFRSDGPKRMLSSRQPAAGSPNSARRRCSSAQYLRVSAFFLLVGCVARVMMSKFSTSQICSRLQFRMHPGRLPAARFPRCLPLPAVSTVMQMIWLQSQPGT